MFTFINLSVLTALFAVALPILIHLFNRQKKKKIQFSSIRFLKILEKQRLKKVKLYEFLLILIRSLVVFFLVFAFARPTLKSNPLFSGNKARTTAVILLDNSINMRRYDEKGNRFSRARDALTSLLKNFNSGDQVFIIQTSNPDIVLKNAAEIEQRSATYLKGAWDFSFRTAEMIIKDHPNFNKEVFIVSDFQFRDPGFSEFISHFADTRFFMLKIGDKPVNNISIDTLIVSNQIFEPNQPIKLEAGLRYDEFTNGQQTEVHLFVDNQRVFHQRVSITGQSREDISISFVPRHSGILNGYVEISDDDLLADNRYYFTINIPDKLNILFVDNNPSPFIRAALKSLSEKSNVNLTNENYNTWARQSFQQFDLIWLANFPILPGQIIPRLSSFLKSGRTLILMPGTLTIPSDFNRYLAELNSQIKVGELYQTESQNDFFTIKIPNLNHPLFYGLFRSDEPDISKPKFYRFFNISGNTNTDFLLSFQNGQPYLLQDHTNSGSLFIFTGYIDDAWTDLQYRGLFIPLLSRLMHFGQSRKTGQISSIKVGEKKVLDIYYPISNGRFFLELPVGEIQTITPARISQGYQFNLNRLVQPGLYQIRTNEKKVISAIAVNCQSGHLFDPFLDLEETAASFNSIKIFSEEEPAENTIVEARFGTELWKIFVLLALAFLGLELVVIRLMEGKQKK